MLGLVSNMALTSDISVLDAARALQPEFAERAQEMEDVRRLPADLAQKMADAGIFRMITPSVYGGLESSPRESSMSLKSSPRPMPARAGAQ